MSLIPASGPQPVSTPHSAFDLASLGYLLVACDGLDDWRSFGERCLGMQIVDQSRNTVAFRMDDRPQRLIVSSEPLPARYTVGWQASSAGSLEQIAARLSRSGIVVERGTRPLADQRMVRDLIFFRDPVGNRIEVFIDAGSARSPFVPGRMHSGFRTGSMGLGHVVLTAASLDEMIPFYRDLLGFRVSDYQLAPFPAFFFHLNQRHHSLALIQQGQAGIHHVMIEHRMLDDVGQGYDIALTSGQKIGVTLGRHTNDLMTSFYVHAPSPFMVEVGWGGREIDPDSWRPMELKNGPSLWGHDRNWLSPEQFAEARRMRLAAAAEGVRAPVHVLPERYRVVGEG